MTELQQLESNLKDAENAFRASVRSRECPPDNAAGKTVKAVEHGSVELMILFDDGTYMYFETSRDTDDSYYLIRSTPDKHTGLRLGLGDPDITDRVARLRQALMAHKHKSQYLQQVAKLVQDIGKENVLRLLKETP